MKVASVIMMVGGIVALTSCKNGSIFKKKPATSKKKEGSADAPAEKTSNEPAISMLGDNSALAALKEQMQENQKKAE